MCAVRDFVAAVGAQASVVTHTRGSWASRVQGSLRPRLTLARESPAPSMRIRVVSWSSTAGRATVRRAPVMREAASACRRSSTEERSGARIGTSRAHSEVANPYAGRTFRVRQVPSCSLRPRAMAAGQPDRSDPARRAGAPSARAARSGAAREAVSGQGGGLRPRPRPEDGSFKSPRTESRAGANRTDVVNVRLEEVVRAPVGRGEVPRNLRVGRVGGRGPIVIRGVRQKGRREARAS